MRRLTCGALGVLAFLTTSASATAAPVTIGSPLTGPFLQAEFLGDQTVANLRTASGPVTAPVSGAIVRWRIAEANGNFRLRVLRQSLGFGYRAVASSTTQNPNNGTRTYATVLPIQAGDTIGLDAAKGAKIAAQSGASQLRESAYWLPALGDAEGREPSGTEPGREFAFNADILPAPTVTALAPASGPIAGGTAVTITGTDLAATSAVQFGTVPAASFTVAGDGTVNAVAPATAKGPVNVTVTTVAGTSAASAANSFTFTACVVPKLKEKTLKAAKRRLKKAGCRVGKVNKRKGVTAKTGDVVRQGKAAGKQLPPGTKVSITLG